VDTKEYMGPVLSCWPRIRSVPLDHFRVVGSVFSSLQKTPRSILLDPQVVRVVGIERGESCLAKVDAMGVQLLPA
jgi:hypothetical protein